MKSSRRDLFIDIVVDRLISKNNLITLFPHVFIPNTGMGLDRDWFLLCTFNWNSSFFPKRKQYTRVIYFLIKRTPKNNPMTSVSNRKLSRDDEVSKYHRNKLGVKQHDQISQFRAFPNRGPLW